MTSFKLNSSLKKTYKLLNVEDDHVQYILLKELLSSDKESSIQCIVDNANSLKSALQKIHSTQYDLILFDLGLPDSRGTHTLDSLKNAAPSVPLVLLLAPGSDRTLCPTYHEKICACISKDEIIDKMNPKFIESLITHHSS